MINAIERMKNGDYTGSKSIYDATVWQVRNEVAKYNQDENVINGIVEKTYQEAFINIEQLTDASMFVAWTIQISQKYVQKHLQEQYTVNQMQVQPQMQMQSQMQMMQPQLQMQVVPKKSGKKKYLIILGVLLVVAIVAVILFFVFGKGVKSEGREDEEILIEDAIKSINDDGFNSELQSLWHPYIAISVKKDGEDSDYYEYVTDTIIAAGSEESISGIKDVEIVSFEEKTMPDYQVENYKEMLDEVADEVGKDKYNGDNVEDIKHYVVTYEATTKSAEYKGICDAKVVVYDGINYMIEMDTAVVEAEEYEDVDLEEYVDIYSTYVSYNVKPSHALDSLVVGSDGNVDEFYILINDYVEAYDTIKLAHKKCLTSEQYSEVEEKLFKSLDLMIAQEVVAFESIVSLYKNNKDSKDLKEYLDYQVESINIALEIFELDLEILEDDNVKTIIEDYSADDIKNSLDSGINVVSIIVSDSDISNYEELYETAVELTEKSEEFFELYSEIMEYVNKNTTLQELLLSDEGYTDAAKSIQKYYNELLK